MDHRLLNEEPIELKVAQNSGSLLGTPSVVHDLWADVHRYPLAFGVQSSSCIEHTPRKSRNLYEIVASLPEEVFGPNLSWKILG